MATMTLLRQKNLAADILSASEGLDTFWYSLHVKEENAKKKAATLNVVLKGTGAKALVDFARNFNFSGKDWGVVIKGLTKGPWLKIVKKYKLEGYDYD